MRRKGGAKALRRILPLRHQQVAQTRSKAMKASKIVLALVLGLATSFAFAATPMAGSSANGATGKAKCEKGQHHDAAGKCVAGKPKAN